MSYSVKEIAGYAPGVTENVSMMTIEEGEVEHRLDLQKFWNIAPGSRILEIGCGQGTTTTVLGAIVGPDGHIDAVDPGPPDYGSPFTLSQAQSHISTTAIGKRITWHNDDPIEFLKKNPDPKWDYAIFAHCLWYFDSKDEVSRTLAAVKGRANKLLVAEYAMKATEKAALPHVLAAITRASLEAHNKESEANIRCLLGPQSIKDLATAAGWTLEGESEVVPAEELQDGHWEVSEVKANLFVTEVDKYIEDERVNAVIKSSREALLAAIAAAEGKKMRTMDVWVSTFN